MSMNVQKLSIEQLERKLDKSSVKRDPQKQKAIEDELEFKRWLDKQSDQVKSMDRSGQELAYNSFKQQSHRDLPSSLAGDGTSQDNVGLTVETSHEPALDSEEQQVRMSKKAAARQKAVAEVAQMKASIGDNLVLTSDPEHTFQPIGKEPDNVEFRNKAIKAFVDAERPAADSPRTQEDAETLYERKEHFADHLTLTNKKQYRAYKKELHKDGVKYKDIKDEVTYVRNKDVRDYINEHFVDENGLVDQQKLKNFVAQYTGLDFELNYGIHRVHNGSMVQDELKQLMDVTGLSRRECQKLVKAAGGYAEKSDKGQKIGMAAITAIPGGIIGGLIGMAVGSTLTPNITITDELFAGVYNSATQEWVDVDYKKLVTNLTNVGQGASLAAGAISGAVIGIATAILNTALTYQYDGKRDIFGQGQIEDFYDDPEKILKAAGSQEADLAAGVVKLLKEGGVPKESFMQAIRVAMGNASSGNVNLNELLAACEMLKNMDPNDYLKPKECHEGEEQVLSDGAEEADSVEQPAGDRAVLAGNNGDDAAAQVTQVEEQNGNSQGAGAGVGEADGVREEVQTTPTVNNPRVPQDDGNGKTANQTVVTVMNGESFAKIAKKYGISVNELIELNRDKIHGHFDCEKNRRVEYFRVGAEIILPAGANLDAVKDNQQNVTKQKETQKYRTQTTADANVNRLADKNCRQEINAAGTEVKRLVDAELKRRNEANANSGNQS